LRQVRRYVRACQPGKAAYRIRKEAASPATRREWVLKDNAETYVGVGHPLRWVVTCVADCESGKGIYTNGGKTPV
jgi:hypothetical protein